MEKIILTLGIFFLLSNIITGQNTSPGFSSNSYVEQKWPDGTIREKADWKDGLIIGTRQLFNPQGKLIEEHIFSKDSVVIKDGKPERCNGNIKTYYPSGAIASDVPALELLRPGRNGNEYLLRVRDNDTVVGYYEDHKIAYKYMVELPVLLNNSSSDSYKNLNIFYKDVFLQHKTVKFEGLHTEVIFFNPDESFDAKGTVHNGKRVGYWKHHYPNGKISAEGNYLEKGLEIEYKVGPWKFYNENGVLVKEAEYYKAGNSKLKYGDYINLYKEYSQEGKLMFVIQYPAIEDVTMYSDTIETYYPNGNLKYKYDKTDQATMYTGAKYKYCGKVVKYYDDGKLMETGYLSKIPRFKPPDEEVKFTPCILNDNKKIGFWYYFTPDGTMSKITEYFLCGEVKNETPADKVKKEASKYNKQKGKYEFEFTIKI